MKAKPLTPQQLRVFEAIKQHWFTHGIPASTAELANLLGVSRQNIYHHIVNLKRKGFLSEPENTNRTVTPVLKKTEPGAFGAHLRTSFQIRFIPILRQAAEIISFLSSKQDKIEGGLWIEWPNLTDTLFAIPMFDNSMIKAGLLLNDFIIIRRQFTATDGDIVLVLIDDVTPMIKRLKRNQGRIGLFSADDISKPLWYSSTRVSFQGIVVETRRNYKVGENPIA